MQALEETKLREHEVQHRSRLQVLLYRDCCMLLQQERGLIGCASGNCIQERCLQAAHLPGGVNTVVEMILNAGKRLQIVEAYEMRKS